MRLGDLDAFKNQWNADSYVGKLMRAAIDSFPTIDPEDLPAVRELREQLAKVVEEREAAVKDLSVYPRSDTCKNKMKCPYFDETTGIYNCKGCDYWAWRGIQEVQDNE